MPKDYYAILGVKKDATEDELKKAFRRLAHEHHPDKGGDPAKFKDMNEAYQVLSDKQKRQMYDQFGSDAFSGGSPGAGGAGGFGGFGGFNQDFQGAGFEDLGDMLGEMFGFGGTGRTSRKPQGKNIEMDVELTFREAAFGVEKTVHLFKPSTCSRCHGDGGEPGTKVIDCATCKGTGQIRQLQRTVFGSIQVATTCTDCHGRGKKPEKPCTTCRGTGVERREANLTIRIPSGIDNGETVKVSGEGEAAPHGGQPGDLYLHVRVKADPQMERQDHDVLSTAQVPFSLLALGGEWEVETLDGKSSIKIPEGTPAGTSFTLRGKGIVFSRSGNRGNHIVQVVPETPKKLSKEQRKMLEDLRGANL